MPGPGRGRRRPKPTSSSPRLPHPSQARIEGIDDAEGWYLIITILCKAYKLPDLTRVSGLRKVHAKFESIYTQLDTGYTRYSSDDKVAGGIVGIFAKMCSDTVLRNKLISKGLLDKVFPLLARPACRHIALRALGTITQNPGVARVEVVIQAPILIRLIAEHVQDSQTTELAVSSLAYSIPVLVDIDHPDFRSLRPLLLPKILEVTVTAIKQPNATPLLLTSAMRLFVGTTSRASSIFKENRSVINFIVAGLRSSDWVMKCLSFGAIVHLHEHEAESDAISFDGRKVLAAACRGFPNHIQHVLNNYGMERTDTIKLTLATRDFHQALATCIQDRNLYSLGLKLANLILFTEFSIADGPMYADLPFTTSTEALPLCSKAIRERGNREQLDLADVLDIKFAIKCSRISEAREIAKKALERNPDFAYFHHPTTLCANTADALRAAKKGLKCRKTTPFIRSQMLQRAVEYAGILGLESLQDASDAGDKKWEEGIAFLISAYEDAKTYVAEASPDSRRMKDVLCWLVILTIMVEENISPDLRELKHHLDRLKLSDDIKTFLGLPRPRTNINLTMQKIVQTFAQAVEEFGEIIAQKTAPEQKTEIDATKAEDDLAAWLDDLRTEDGSEEPKARSHPSITLNHIKLYQCSWCGNPSAVLKKCTACGKVMYCDSGCQKSHWSEHKKVCTK